MKLPKGTKEVFGITGMSLGLGIAGSAVSGINADIGSGLTNAGSSSSGFIKPAVNISMGGTIIKMLRDIK